MEGPSLVIMKEELQPYVGKKTIGASGTAKIEPEALIGQTLREVRTWGKHALLCFDRTTLRIHFLMFGSYRINDERDRAPKLQLRFRQHVLSFYSCAIRKLSDEELAAYDSSVDIMADAWNPIQARKKVRADPDRMVCDVLMDQTIFAGLGNIMKNEVLFRLHLHPEERISALTSAQVRGLVSEARTYAEDFYRWKKAGELKKNWQIFRKRICRDCSRPVVKAKTGLGERIGHFCPSCQPISGASLKSLGLHRRRGRSVKGNPNSIHSKAVASMVGSNNNLTS